MNCLYRKFDLEDRDDYGYEFLIPTTVVNT